MYIEPVKNLEDYLAEIDFKEKFFNYDLIESKCNSYFPHIDSRQFEPEGLSRPFDSNEIFGRFDSSRSKEHEISVPIINSILGNSNSARSKKNGMSVLFSNRISGSSDFLPSKEHEMSGLFSKGILVSSDSLESKGNEMSGPFINRIFGSSDSFGSKENEKNVGSIVANKKIPTYQEIGENISTVISSKKEMNVGTNNMLPSNQETVKKSAKEENKESFSTPPSSKKKCKYKKRKIFKIFKIPKKFHKKIEKIVAKRKRIHYINGKHNKFAYDNMTRKLKVHLFESIKVLLNASLREDEVENPKKNSKKRIVSGPFFVKIKQEIIRVTTVEDNNTLLKIPIKDIFSKEVSLKYKKYNKKELIDKICEEKKKTKTIGILDKTFFQCLQHFRGSKKYKELEGLENEYINVINQLRNKEEKEENIEKFKKFVEGFEEYYKKKDEDVKKSKKN